jgi:arylsulfatase A-like enzyme/Tfp pilus assembly protein PilF
LVVALLVLGLSGAYWRLRAPATDEGASEALRERGRKTPVNVVFVTLDTLRADRLPAYGFKGVETPNLDAFASEGVVFDHVTTTVPLTLPAHSTLMTGRLPSQHGVRDNGGYFLGEEEETLAEKFKTAGYETGAFVAAWVLAAKWGIGQGFDTYSDAFDLSKYKTLSLGTVQKPGDEVMTDALAWLETRKAKPFFAWIHLYDPHTPYEPPEPFKSKYADRPYIGEIAYTDSVLGRLRDFLRTNNLLERTIVVLTADHGEGLGDHDESTHAFFVYDSTMHVPLIVRTPWGDRGRAGSPVSSADIAPTLVDLTGLPPFAKTDGKSAARLILDPGAEVNHESYVETYFTRFHFGWQHLRGLRVGEWKFIDAPEPELYKVSDDPGETANLYKANSLRAEEMKKRLIALAGDGNHAPPERANMDPETLERLAALGYVGSTVKVEVGEILPDPKSKIAIFNKMGLAKTLAQDNRIDEAIARMREVLAEDPGIIDAHLTLGNWLNREKRTPEAIAAYKTVLTLQPENVIAMNNLAQVYRAQRNWPAAIEGFKTALKLDPKSPQAWFQLATLYLDLNRTKEAETTFREALKHNPKMGASYSSLGVIAFERGDLREAEVLVRQALVIEPDLRTGHYTLARVLEEAGRKAEAKSLYERELATYPDHGRARFNLAQMLRADGDITGFLRELRMSTEKSPEFGHAYFFLAREELNAGRLEVARDLAQRGLKVDSSSEVAPLGHYVLADILSREGKPREAAAEAAKGRAIESRRLRPNLAG